MTTTRRRTPRAGSTSVPNQVPPTSPKQLVPKQRGRVRNLLSLRRAPSGAVMICPKCELQGGPFAAAEAEHLAAVHDQLHHYGARHAEVMN